MGVEPDTDRNAKGENNKLAGPNDSFVFLDAPGGTHMEWHITNQASCGNITFFIFSNNPIP